MEIKITSVMKPLAIIATMTEVLAGMKVTAFIIGPFVLALLFVAVLRPAYGAMLRKKSPCYFFSFNNNSLYSDFAFYWLGNIHGHNLNHCDWARV